MLREYLIFTRERLIILLFNEVFCTLHMNSNGKISIVLHCIVWKLVFKSLKVCFVCSNTVLLRPVLTNSKGFLKVKI